MKRFASIWLPNFAIDRIRRNQPRSGPASTSDQPLALIASRPRGVTITAINPAARKSGIQIGQMLTDARAILPGLRTQPATPSGDAHLLAQLALWLGRYGPLRNTDGDDGLWVDITGVARLFGGEAALAGDCANRLHRAGFEARIAIADTRSAAHALARYGAPRQPALIAPAGTTREMLANLPVECLQLNDDLALLLRRLGLKRIGQLYDLPRPALARRFDESTAKQARQQATPRNGPRHAAAMLVRRLDQALGELGEPTPGIQPPPVYRVQRAYAEPLVSNEGIATALKGLAARLCQKFKQQDAGARSLRFTIYRTDGTHADTIVRTSRPARDESHIIKLFETHFERMDKHMDVGLGLDAISLEALTVDQLKSQQVDLGSHTERRGLTTELIDRLVNRLGSRAIFRLDAVASYVPELAQRQRPALGESPSSRTRKSRARGSNRSGAADIIANIHQPARPIFLLQPAETIKVATEAAEGPPARFVWRRVSRRIVHAQGPERISPEWWHLIWPETFQEKADAPATSTTPHTASGRCKSCQLIDISTEKTRDYYRIEDEHGGVYWIYRAGLQPSGTSTAAAAAATAISSIWYLQGIF